MSIKDFDLLPREMWIVGYIDLDWDDSILIGVFHFVCRLTWYDIYLFFIVVVFEKHSINKSSL